MVSPISVSAVFTIEAPSCWRGMQPKDDDIFSNKESLLQEVIRLPTQTMHYKESPQIYHTS